MRIKIIDIKMTNFKCFRDEHFELGGETTTIKGRNGVGKTTIADAILWCLFGKNVAGQSDLELFKTRVDGKVIPNVDHSVELTLEVARPGTEAVRKVTLKRSIKEVWVKKRGSDEQVFKNNTVEYMVNGEMLTMADYKKYIDGLVSEEVFRAITNPAYFLTLKWQVQRDALQKMAGELPSDERFKKLEVMLTSENEDIVAYRKHLSYQIKQVKDKLDKIPVRLEEQHKALPEKQDWDALEGLLTSEREAVSEIDQKLYAIKNGNGSDVRMDELRMQAADVRKEQDDIMETYRRQALEKSVRHHQRMNEVAAQFNALLFDQRDLERAISSMEKLADRCRETLASCEKDAQEIRTKWSENNARVFEWDEDSSFCPTCGQALPMELLQQKQQEAVERFNKGKAEVKAALTKKANEVKALRAQAEEELKGYEERKAESEERLAETKGNINKIFAEKADTEKEHVATADELMKDDPRLQELRARLADIQQKMQTVGTSEEDVQRQKELKDERERHSNELSRLNALKGTKQQYERVMSLIEDIDKEQEQLVGQLSELEKVEDEAIAYHTYMNKVLEERVNKLFSVVQWRMFRTVNNGGDSFDEPYCEAYVDGIAYNGGLNQAARLNAGLDVINTLCRHYGVVAPIVLDNAESSLKILETEGQQIRLMVEDTELTLA